MTPAVEHLVREAIELTGVDAPQLLQADAPVLAGDALNDESFYLVGLIGGKDVGKSALVNALAGRKITETTSHGPGTEIVVAYAHVSQEPALRTLLEKEVPGHYRLVTHEISSLKRQVLLDLPDIDSRWESHPLVVRAMLRHTLYPLWIVSIEKYADRQPQDMLRKVADGNAPENFLFCLNKADQAPESAQREIRDDYAARLTNTLGLSHTPQVFLISAIHPDRFELPRLKQTMSREKPDDSLRTSRQLAVARQDRTLLTWLDGQDLPQRAERLARLEADAQELIAERIGIPLLERIVPRLLDDPATRLAMSDEILRERVARWPLVNLIHTLFTPLMSIWRANLSPAGSLRLQGSDALVETYLQDDGRPISSLVNAAFAQLRQSNPVVATLYAENRLWEEMSADFAAGDLRRRFSATVDRQRRVARQQLASRRGIFAPLRWLLTIGALLWFPIIQPILEAFLTTDIEQTPRKLAGIVVGILSGSALLKNVSFLALWFLVIWLALRWNTQRCVNRLLAKWKSASYPDRTLNLNVQAMDWMAGLIQPIRLGRESLESICQRAQQLKRGI